MNSDLVFNDRAKINLFSTIEPVSIDLTNKENMSDCVRINNYISDEWLILKSEEVMNKVKQEKIENTFIFDEQSNNNEKLYILHDCNSVICDSKEIKTEPDVLIIKNIKSLRDENVNSCISQIDSIKHENQELKIQWNLSNNVENLTEIENRNFLDFINKDLKSIDKTSFNHENCNIKQKIFQLKQIEQIVESNSSDTSHLKLKDLVNLIPHLAAPKSRMHRKYLGEIKNFNKQAQSNLNNADEKSIKNFRINLDGEVVFDEDNDKEEPAFNIDGIKEIVLNSHDIKSNSRSFMKRRLSGKRWSCEERNNFYKALMVTGTDFTRMATIFPQRSRDDLKKKFKVEEKLNSVLIDRILLNRVSCDPSLLKLDSHLIKKDDNTSKKRIRKSSHSDINHISTSIKKLYGNVLFQ